VWILYSDARKQQDEEVGVKILKQVITDKTLVCRVTEDLIGSKYS